MRKLKCGICEIDLNVEDVHLLEPPKGCEPEIVCDKHHTAVVEGYKHLIKRLRLEARQEKVRSKVGVIPCATEKVSGHSHAILPKNLIYETATSRCSKIFVWERVFHGTPTCPDCLRLLEEANNES